MLRRLATFVLALCVTTAGLMAKPHAAACCIVQQASAHDCCKAPVQLKPSDCCRGNQQLAHRAVHTQALHQPALPVALATTSVERPQSCTFEPVLAPAAHGLAPPGSLIVQHTSLLV